MTKSWFIWNSWYITTRTHSQLTMPRASHIPPNILSSDLHNYRRSPTFLFWIPVGQKVFSNLNDHILIIHQGLSCHRSDSLLYCSESLFCTNCCVLVCILPPEHNTPTFHPSAPQRARFLRRRCESPQDLIFWELRVGFMLIKRSVSQFLL